MCTRLKLKVDPFNASVHVCFMDGMGSVGSVRVFLFQWSVLLCMHGPLTNAFSSKMHASSLPLQYVEFHKAESSKGGNLD
jgi:hypothetical protein